MKQIHIILILFLLSGASSCQKFLDVRPDKKQVIPTTLKDCRGLLDDYATMNTSYPSDGEVAANNYYLLPEDWQALNNKEDRDTYTWQADGEHLTSQWMGPYQVVYNANLVLETLGKIRPQATEQAMFNELKGSALFFRSYAFYQLAQLFAPPYDPVNASSLPGIPTRLSPDMAVKSTRGTVEETYKRIIEDLQLAVTLLPEYTILPTRPTKAAAYAALARSYLTMQDYNKAGEMAGECLKLKNELMDYNTIDAASGTPFAQFNKEVIFHSLAGSTDVLYSTVVRIDDVLLKSYAADDLRLAAFFENNGDDTFSFKGNYDGTAYSSEFFNGLATDEIYLIRAECYARAGNTAMAIADLNTLLKNRIDAGSYEPYETDNADAALSKIQKERRKELLFRNLYWTDLRRLNQDPEFAVELTRKLVMDGVEKSYKLPAKDLRYTFLIPRDVMINTDLKQNKR